jgi:Fic family protein
LKPLKKLFISLFENDRNQLNTLGFSDGFGTARFLYFTTKTIISIAKAAEETGLTVPTVTTAFEHLMKLSMVREVTERKRGRLYMYARYVDILNEGIG